MGCRAHILLTGGSPGLVDRAVERLQELERRWSRFRPDSEISQLNCHAGETVEVSADTVRLLRLARRAWTDTGGRFDPTVLPALVAAGFGPARDGTAPPVVTATVAAGGMAGVRTGPRAGQATLPPGTAFDPGGLGKGLAADIVVSELLAAGAFGALVNIGGDLRCAGAPPSPDGWVIAIERPDRPDEEVARVALPAGGAGVATTSPRGRWSPVGADASGPLHHLIDPATGRPSTSSVEQVTVIAADAAEAEVLAKAAYLAGEAHAAADYVDARGAAGVVVARDGSVVVSARAQGALV